MHGSDFAIVRRVLRGLIGAVLGYLVVTLALGWFATGGPTEPLTAAIALAHVAGVIAGVVIAVRQPRQSTP
jgi:membrane associated rhomboid family serine protease